MRPCHAGDSVWRSPGSCSGSRVRLYGELLALTLALTLAPMIAARTTILIRLPARENISNILTISFRGRLLPLVSVPPFY
jgi:hypothetical protein